MQVSPLLRWSQIVCRVVSQLASGLHSIRNAGTNRPLIVFGLLVGILLTFLTNKTLADRAHSDRLTRVTVEIRDSVRQARQERIKAVLERFGASGTSGYQTNFVVTSDGDEPDDSLDDLVPDPPTLRATIQTLQLIPGPHKITFDSGIDTIHINSTPAIISEPTTIDGENAPGERVVLDGSLATDDPFSAETGLVATGDGHTVRNLEIMNFHDGGIALTSGASNSIIRNCIVHHIDGPGISCNASNKVVIDSNIIYGNTGSGGHGISLVALGADGCDSNVIRHNFIGTPDGMTAVANSRTGIQHSGGLSNVIYENVISGNNYFGIRLGAESDAPTMDNEIFDNLIGVNLSGTDTIPNGAGNSGEGISVGFSDGDIIAMNVICGNAGGGIEFTRDEVSNMEISFNTIGLDVLEGKPLGNLNAGVLLRGKKHTVWGNAVGANQHNGLAAACDSSTVTGNFVGAIDPSEVGFGNKFNGITIQGSGNVVGGSNVADRNISSGNGGSGVRFFTVTSTDNLVENNYIGTDTSGAVAVPNGSHGLRISAGISGNTIRSNLISGNGGDGVQIAGNSSFPCRDNVVVANKIGTDKTMTAPLPNQNGINVTWGVNTRIGGDTTADRNAINFNTLDGIYIVDTDSTAIKHNQILSNGGDGITIVTGGNNAIRYNDIGNNGEIGIDLNDDGPTPNDAGDGDGGANALQNHPLLDTVYSAGAQTVVEATMEGLPNYTYEVDFFSNGGCDPSGFGEGDMWLDSMSVTTDQFGVSEFIAFLPFQLDLATQNVVMTATDGEQNTSEFSPCQVADVDTADVTVVKSASADTVLEGDTITYTLSVVNNGPHTATGVVALDSLPSEVTYVDAQVTVGSGTCTYLSSTVTCQFGNLAASDVAEAEIRAVADSVGLSINSAIAASSTVDPDPFNNVDSARVEIVSGDVSCCVGIRGNVNDSGDDVIDILDLTFLVQYMFGGGPAPPCLDEADVNGAPEPVDILDLTYLVDFMFRLGPEPPGCP